MSSTRFCPCPSGAKRSWTRYVHSSVVRDAGACREAVLLSWWVAYGYWWVPVDMVCASGGDANETGSHLRLIGQVERAFDRYDFNEDGFIDARDLQNAMLTTRKQISKAGTRLAH